MPLMLGDYPGVVLAFGRYIAFETLSALLYAFLWYGRWPGVGEAAGIVLLGVRVFRPA